MKLGYLGLEFQINGRTHYGWAQVIINAGYRGFALTLIDIGCGGFEFTLCNWPLLS
jgi:hypothetical protein